MRASKTPESDPRGLLAVLLADGRPPLAAVGLALVAAGIFASFQAITGHLLPHDQAWLGLTTAELRSIAGGRVLLFMIHDRVAFGGALIGIGTLFVYLTASPLRRGESWAWWALFNSGLIGFASFLTYLGHGYLDTWHGAATLIIAPLFVVGLWRSRGLKQPPRGPGVLSRPNLRWPVRSAAGLGHALLLTTSACVALGGLIIMTVGVTTVFVPQDLVFMGLSVDDFHAVSPRLIPLIAHDRAGFGGAVCATGVCLFHCLWCGRPEPALWQAVLVAMVAGFGTAIGIHFPIGYTAFLHLAPAYLGAVMFLLGMALSWRAAHRPPRRPPTHPHPAARQIAHTSIGP